MKQLFLLLISFYLFSLGACSQPVAVSKGTGGNFTLSFEKIILQIDAEKGGRVTSLKFNNTEILYLGSNLFNSGSTFWPSPQAVWIWPPISALDNKPYSTQIIKDTVLLQSATDSKYNLKVYKKFHIDVVDTSIVITYILKNEGTIKASWAPWEVTRVPANGMTFFAKGDTNVWGTMSTKAELQNNYYWYDQTMLNSASSNKKFFSDGKGWLAHVNSNNLLFIKKFEDISTKMAAKDESEVEVYTSPDLSYTELENQGKLSVLNPGDSVSYKVKWFLRTIPSTMISNKGNQKLINYVLHVIQTSSRTDL
jgi:hypothetical protein